MNKLLAQFLHNKYSTEPFKVDRIIVTAFLEKNKLKVKHNLFLKRYIIPKTNKKDRKALQDFLDFMTKRKISFAIENLIELFEFVISPEEKVITGAVYTPSLIREYIVNKTLTPSQAHTAHLADISCGCGGFLYNAAKTIRRHTGRTFYQIFNRQLFGLDIASYSVNRTKLLLSLLAISEGEDRQVFKFNLFCGNALSFKWKGKIPGFQGFDLVLGNPPYVCARNIARESRDLLHQWRVCASGHPDLYIPFFQIALENLKPEGTVGYITMNTFFKSVNGRALRQYFQEHAYRMDLLDFGTLQVFKSRSTYTCICLIKKATAEAIRYRKCDDLADLNNRNGVIAIPYAGLEARKGWNLNHNQELITRIESAGKPFRKTYKTRNGFATLKNDVYLFVPTHESREYYFLKHEQTFYPIEKAICKEAVNPNLLTSVTDLKSIKEKLIFPYEFIDGKPSPIPKTRFERQYPRAHKYLSIHRNVLAKRDKGKGKDYAPWFMFGRTQSLEKLTHKLFFPHITSQIPNYLIDSDEDLLFYNGLAVIGKSVEELLILRKLLSSRLFWFYIKTTSKPYGSSFFSLSSNYLKDFGIYQFTPGEKQYILREEDKDALDRFFEEKYEVAGELHG